MKNTIFTILFAVACIVSAFSLGLAVSQHNKATQCSNELSQCNVTLSTLTAGNNARLLTVSLDDCLHFFNSYRAKYPNYWTGSELIELNGEDDDLQFCEYMELYYSN